MNNTTDNITQAGFVPYPTGSPYTSFIRFTDLAEDAEYVQYLGQPIVRAIPHHTSLNPLNPDICQFVLNYSLCPTNSICICYGNGSLEKLLAHEGFINHVKEHVRNMTRIVNSDCIVSRMFGWEFTEYFLESDGKGRIVRARDEKNLSPLVRAAVKENRIERRLKALVTSSKKINRTSFTCRGTTEDFITPEIRATLHGKLEEYGLPVFRRISDPKNPGVSQIKMNFSKVPNSQMQVTIDCGSGGDGAGEGNGEEDDDGEGPTAVDEEEMIREVKRQVMGVLFGEDWEYEAVKIRLKNRDRKKRCGNGDATSGDEVDQEIETLAMRRQYWGCYRDGEDVITKDVDEE